MAHTPIGARKERIKRIMSELKEKIITEIKKIYDPEIQLIFMN